MDKFLQEKLMPIAIKLGNNKGLVALGWNYACSTINVDWFFVYGYC